MARNGSGTYSLPAGNPVTTGAVISSTWANNTLDDIATALTASLAKDGQTTPTANLPMATYKHTGVGTATATTDYARADQVQNSTLQYLSSVSGADTITASASITPAAYAAGQTFRFISAGANTGAATLNVSSLGAKSIKKQGTNALAAGDIASGALIEVTYDGTNFQLTTPSAAASIALSDNNTWTGIQSFNDGKLALNGATSGTQTLKAAAIASTYTATLPAGTTTLLGSSVTATLGVGYSATPYNAGTKSSGTFTPDEANGNLQYAVNGGAHTLAPPTNNCSIVIQYTNNGSAGTITTSGFTKVSGSSLTTTNGDDFMLYIMKLNGFSHLNVVALQ